MSKAADNLAARAARVASRRTQEAPTAAEQAPPAPRARPIRITIDLAPVLHRELARWCANAADQVGVAKVPAAEVVRALIRELDTDPDLTTRIIASLRTELEN